MKKMKEGGVINYDFMSVSTYKYSQFETDFLSNGKADDAIASGYLEEFNNKILLASGDGNFLYFKKSDLISNKFNANLIKSNIKDIIKYSQFYTKSKFKLLIMVRNPNKEDFPSLRWRESPNFWGFITSFSFCF